MPKKITIDVLKERIKKVHGDLVTIKEDTYLGTTKNAIFIDSEFGEWSATPENVCRGRGHPDRWKSRRKFVKLLTPDQIQQRIDKIHGHGIVTLVKDTYKNTTTKCTLIDKDYGPWEAYVSDVFCPKKRQRHPRFKYDQMSKNRKMTLDQFKKKLFEIFGDTQILDESTYKSIHEKVRIIDKDYGPRWVYPKYVLRGNKHPKRVRAEMLVVPINEIKNKIYEMWGDTIQIVDSTYKSSCDKCTFIDKKYGEWITTPYNVLKRGCTHPLRSKGSKWAREFSNFLKENRIDFILNSRDIIAPFELDFYIPSKKIAFELNGTYWHNSKKKDRKYHLNKSNKCQELGIQLIHIFEYQWLHRKPQLLNFIKSKLLPMQRVYARKCTLKQVSKSEANEFLDNNHIQGRVRFIDAWGLYYDGKLISMATFGHHHRNNGKIVLNRFCSAHPYTVIGGLSRLTKAAYDHYKSPIITWSDRSLTCGESYRKAGWKLDAIIPPDYFYIKGDKLVSKQSRKKSNVKTPEHMTESQHAELDGLHKIWDCGKIRWVYCPD